MVRHSHEDALDETQFERLVDATDKLDAPFDAEAMFILIAGGRLGMRAGEISHLSASWVNWSRSVIEIPRHAECRCGYCQKQARQMCEYDEALSFDEALATRWEPKTETSARAIPFDFDERVEATLKAFLDAREKYPHSRVSVNRRVTRVAKAAGMDPDRVYPHALRATAATYHAFKGLNSTQLQAIMGWKDAQTAMKYIRLSGGAAAEALRDVHDA